MKGGHRDELPGQDVKSGSHTVPFPSTLSAEQTPTDATVRGLLLGEAPASVDVRALDRSNLGERDLDRSGAFQGVDLDPVERRFIRVESEET